MIRHSVVLLPVILFSFSLVLSAQTPDLNSTKAKAEAGDAASQLVLARAYDKGEGVPKNDRLAAKWYLAAADQGNAEAQTSLGLLYRLGRGVDKNKEEAAKWFGKAASQGDARGMYNLAVCYYNGDGVPINDTGAYAWFLLAASAGSTDAADAAQRMKPELPAFRLQDAELLVAESLEKGKVVPSNPKEAADIYRSLADQGNAIAQVKLASMYGDGRGVPQDFAMMKSLCERAAKTNFAPGLFCMGHMAENGTAGPVDFNAAAKWFQKAATLGHPMAAYRLGLAYVQGRGTKRDPVMAYRWLHLASDFKVDGATTALQQVERSMSPKDLDKAKRSLISPPGLIDRTAAPDKNK